MTSKERMWKYDECEKCTNNTGVCTCPRFCTQCIVRVEMEKARKARNPRREDLKAAIKPLVDRGCTSVEIYELLIYAYQATRQDHGMSWHAIRELIEEIATILWSTSYQIHTSVTSTSSGIVAVLSLR